MRSLIDRIRLWLCSRREHAALEKYYKIYDSILSEVREETFKKFPVETRILIEFINSWADLIPQNRELMLKAANSLSGVLLLYLWKLSNWVTYEILNGRYFEAIRNLRFLFEGSVFAVVIEDAIERVVYEKWGTLSGIGLKTEIFKLWSECRQKKVKRKRGVDVNKVREIVASFIDKHGAKLSEDKKRKYLEVYTQILSDRRLYLSVHNMVDEVLKLLNINQDFSEKLKCIWHELSAHLHFSHVFLEAILDNPELLLLEVMDPKLFKKSLDLYFETLDLYYTVLAWRFPQLKENIRKVVEWWEQNFNKSFNLTKTFLKYMEALEEK